MAGVVLTRSLRTMQTQINHIIAQQRVAELSRIAAETRPAAAVRDADRNHRSRPVARLAQAFARISAARA